MKTIYFGSDHAGFQLKEKLKEFLEGKDYEVEDLGTNSEESCDYPDYAKGVAEKVAGEEETLGILVCGTGIGMSMAANKVKGVRAAVACDEEMAEMSRKHNNANVLCLGARVIDFEKAKGIVEVFLKAEFEGDRHARRVEKINSLD